MKFRKVDPKIWNDSKFNDLSDYGKLTFFFLLTHPHMTPVGAMRGTMAGLAEELGWASKAFREAFGEALAKGMVKHNRKAHFISLPNFMKYNTPESPNVIKAWGKCMDDIPECPEKDQLYHDLKALLEGFSEGFRIAFRKAFAKPTFKAMPNQEQEQEQEQEQDMKEVSNDTSSFPKNGNGGSNGNCPHRQIVNIYHEILPMLPRVRTWTGTNAEKYLKVRWREKTDRRDLEWWRAFFEYIASSDFLCGRKTDFSADLEWIVRKGNFDKILNGRYENRKSQASGIDEWMRIKMEKQHGQ